MVKARQLFKTDRSLKETLKKVRDREKERSRMPLEIFEKEITRMIRCTVCRGAKSLIPPVKSLKDGRTAIKLDQMIIK